MTYRLDDEGAFDRMVVEAGNEVYGSCVRAGQESARQMMGGEFSRAMALAIAPMRIWVRAVATGLIFARDKGAYQLCDLLWGRFNPTAEQAKAMRGKRAVSGRLGGKQKASNLLSKVLSENQAPDVAELYPLGMGNGSGNGSDPEGGPGETRPSETRLKSDRPPRYELTGEYLQVYEAIRNEPKLAGCDAFDLAAHCQPAGAKEKPVAWLLRSVSDAARDTPLGELAHATQRRVRAYLQNARAPKAEPVEAQRPQHVESDDAEAVARIRRGPKRMAFDDPRAAEVVTSLANGFGGLQAPRQPMTEAELRDKAQRDQQRLAELEAKEKTG